MVSNNFLHLVDEYMNKLKNQNKVIKMDNDIDKKIKKAINKMVKDIQDRRGIGQEWECIDNEVQAEIRKTWFDIIKNELTTGDQNGRK